MARHGHRETHRTARVGWLRAAVLGANDGIVSTASLLAGVAAAQVDPSALLVTGVAGVIAGAMSMAAGEYVSVSSQADTERADLARERVELEAMPEHELKELAGLYVARGLPRALAEQVAQALTAHDALGAHARDELGITETAAARPVQAALTSALSFAGGAALPLGAAVLAPGTAAVPAVVGSALLFLVGLGAVAAHLGGAPVARAAARVGAWGALAMGLTALVGRLVGTAV